MGKKVTRLYAQFQPEHYDLDLNIDNENLRFSGQVTITGHKTGRPSRRLAFHQKDLKITEAKLIKHDKSGATEITVDRLNTHKRFQEIRLHATQNLYAGRYTITLAFTGRITKTMLGMYPCYFMHEGVEKYLIATQFESNHAREVFPCVDEPEAKATFQLTLITPKHHQVLSNTPAEKQTKLGERLQTRFEVTPKMSTYLLAFVTGEMHAVEGKSQDGVTVRSWASVAQPKSHLEYSLQEGIKILDFFSDYFGIPYPLSKCDQVALPDFDAGAMENWGLITYREIALLTDPDNRSISNEQYVSLVVAHELSHQWFGDLVTMKWWDDLWLNESFASLMEHLALDALHPDWQQWELYTASDILSTSSRDVYSNIQPVGVDVEDPDTLETLFDPGIVYAKGARLLKMLREFIGDKAFAAGLRQYFKQHAYGNATRDDLWKALSAASKQDVAALMVPWLTQPGMPVIHATQNKRRLQLKQERFLLDAPADTSLWPVPLLSQQPVAPVLFSARETEVQVQKAGYVLLNQFASGHYFVHYTEAAHKDYLAQAVQTQQLPTEARINLLNDMYMLARHGDAPLTDALDMVVRCTKEPRDSVWAVLLRAVGAAQQLTEGDAKAEADLKQLRQQLAGYQYDRLGWDDHPTDDPNTKQLRHTMVAVMIAGEDRSAIDEAVRRYQAAKSLETIQSELRNTIMAAAVRYGQSGVVDDLLNAYPQASPELQLDICSALASTKEPKTAEHIIGKALGKKGLARDQDILRWMALFLRNQYVREVMWSFMEKHWDWLETTLGPSKSFDYLPVYAASVISTSEWAKRYRDFFEPKKPIKTLERNIVVGLADIEARVAWRQRDEKSIKQWLKAHL